MKTNVMNLRHRWLVIHLYLGLLLGLVLTIVGITGSLLVFYTELDEILNPQLVVTDFSKPKLAYESLFQSLRTAEPERQKGWRLEIPDSPERMVTARYYKPRETEHAVFAPLMVAIDPYTGEIVRKALWGQYAMTWIYDLHYTLLLDRNGKVIMAVVGGLSLISLVSGLYLWWPSTHKWRSALSIKRHASSQRLIYDLHKTSGVYSAAVMLILALTGVALEVPEYINPAIDFASPLQTPPKPKSTLGQDHYRKITLDQALAIAQRYYPQARLCWIETPHDPEGAIRINFRQPWEPSQRFPKTNIWIDQYSGEVLAINDPQDFSSGDTLITWLHPLHSGEALGLTGRLLVLAAGLLCPVLFLTGLLRWMQKRQAGKRKKGLAHARLL